MKHYTNLVMAKYSLRSSHVADLRISKIVVNPCLLVSPM